MDHTGAGLAQDIHLVGVHVHAVGGDGLGAQHPELLQPLHHPQARFLQAVPLVGYVLGHMDVKPHVQLPGHPHCFLQRLIGEGQRGV